VNLIELERRHEGLRDTVFHSVFRADILIDTDEAAKKYWESLLRCARDHPGSVPVMPTIYTLQGSRILANGRVEYHRETAESLPFTFGEKNTLDLDEHLKISAELATMKEVLAMLRNREDLNERERRLDENIDVREAAVREVENRHGVRAASEEGREGASMRKRRGSAAPESTFQQQQYSSGSVDHEEEEGPGYRSKKRRM
jgi:hypothetical protein